MGEAVTFKIYRSIWGKRLLSKYTGLYGGSGYFQNVQVYLGEVVIFKMYRPIWGSSYFQIYRSIWGKWLLSKCTGLYGEVVTFKMYSSIWDRLCGLVVRVSGYRYRGLGFDSRRYQIF